MNNIIIEVANSHGGNLNGLLELIDKFSEFQDYGIKFQPFHPDYIATKDFIGYPIYQNLHFTNSQWHQVINISSKTKLVWLDIFDGYGLEILEENFEKVEGLKFQASVLYNYEVISKLSSINKIKEKKIIINVAALSINDIEFFIEKFETEIKPKELILEVGFQGYPTLLEDSGISKINVLKNKFKKKVVFADHVDRDSEYSIWLPIIALASGADYIEKHVLLNKDKTEYDKLSSLDFDEFKMLTLKIKNYFDMNNSDFINQREIDYLGKTMMTPILKNSKNSGEQLSLLDDFIFRRSSFSGLNTKEIYDYVSSYYVLKSVKSSGETLKSDDFKKAKIAVISACRLKSTRLKNKALLKIGSLTSVEFSLKNALNFDNIDQVILATSNLDSDQPLKDYKYNNSVKLFNGSAEDVVDRYLSASKENNIDIIVRVTADCPYLDNDLFQLLLSSHFKNGADFTTGKNACLGTNIEIINVTALNKVKSYFPNAEYSEYMSWYFFNNEDHFKINYVDLPDIYIRDYRLTLDYIEDLNLFNVIDKEIGIQNYNLRDVIVFLDSRPDIAKINQGLTVKYRDDQELINILKIKTKIK